MTSQHVLPFGDHLLEPVYYFPLRLVAPLTLNCSHLPHIVHNRLSHHCVSGHVSQVPQLYLVEDLLSLISPETESQVQLTPPQFADDGLELGPDESPLTCISLPHLESVGDYFA